MADTSNEADPASNAFTLQALEHHKAEGMRLAVRARMIALAVIFVRHAAARRAYLVADDGGTRARLVERALLEMLSSDLGAPAAEA